MPNEIPTLNSYRDSATVNYSDSWFHNLIANLIPNFFLSLLGVPESPAHEYDDYSHHEKYLHHDRNELREVACTVAHVKVKFHGGAAMICQFLTSLYIKMYKRQLEIQVSYITIVILSTETPFCHYDIRYLMLQYYMRKLQLIET